MHSEIATAVKVHDSTTIVVIAGITKRSNRTGVLVFAWD